MGVVGVYSFDVEVAAVVDVAGVVGPKRTTLRASRWSRMVISV